MIDYARLIEDRNSGRNPLHRANVRFTIEYRENPLKTAAEGIPVYDEVETIWVKFGAMDETVRAVEKSDREGIFKEQYQAWKAGVELGLKGTPIDEWSAIPGSAAREFKHVGFHTIEQLAEAPDVAKQKLGTLGRFCDVAKRWVENSQSDQSRVVALEQAVESERKRSKSLEEKLEVLIARINATEGTDLKLDVAERDPDSDILAEKRKRRRKVE
jgi:hypothetical protein